jgi:hypothetical protein
MLRRVALVRTDVSDELSASIIRVTRIGVRGSMLAIVHRLLVTANVVSRPPILIYIYIFVKLQLGFNPVAVVQQYNRQVHILQTNKAQTQYKNTKINDTTTANT